MPADVIEGAYCSGSVARHDDTFACYLAEKVVARVRNRLIASGTKPFPAVKPLEFIAEYAAVRVILAGQSFGKAVQQ
jgi:hypothetical protein